MLVVEALAIRYNPEENCFEALLPAETPLPKDDFLGEIEPI
jgi:hypothetical protein